MLEACVSGGVLVFFRALGLAAFLPITGGISAHSFRFMIAFGLALLYADEAQTHDDVSILLCASEFVFGLLVGLPILLVLSVASAVGEIFDVLRGQTIASMYSPAGDCPASLMGSFLSQYMWVVLLFIGGGDVIVTHLKESLSIVRCGHVLAILNDFSYEKVLLLTMTTMNAAFAICLPFAISFLLVELAAAVLMKLLPGLYFQSEVYEIKSILGFLFLFTLVQSGYEASLLAVLESSYEALRGVSGG